VWYLSEVILLIMKNKKTGGCYESDVDYVVVQSFWADG
jgi:hypothetical protein